ncbi:MAG: hypothetical protein QNK23_10570 [Crocinitomicaceae bacterium]|nr:hypothetical protein [Crocinitomicaceae bacterium]
MSEQVLPLSVFSSPDSRISPQMNIAGNKVTPSTPINSTTFPWPNGAQWFVVFDNKSLKVLANVVSADNTTVPSEIAAFDNNVDAVLVLSSFAPNLNHTPQGALYTALRKYGAGTALTEIEQSVAAFSSGFSGSYSYCFVGTMDNDAGTPGFDIRSIVIDNNTELLLSLVPLDLPDGTVYRVNPLVNPAVAVS